jgi:hypothetical protein
MIPEIQLKAKRLESEKTEIEEKRAHFSVSLESLTQVHDP